MRFLACLFECTEELYCTTPGVGIGGVSMDKMLKFYVKVFYVMGNVLLGELSCTWTGLVRFKVFRSRMA